VLTSWVSERKPAILERDEKTGRVISTPRGKGAASRRSSYRSIT
jgi:hypothetical protein